MKKFFYILLLIIVLAFVAKSCFKADIEHISPELESKEVSKLSYDYGIKPSETWTIDGVDYLKTNVETGKFGGNIVTSTIGEGPKTFNPWESKDATSSAMSDLMFEGLVSTDPYTGEVVPRLAQKIEISKDKRSYIITLRHGLRWSDGVEITADDVVFTWNTLIFGGFGNTSTKDSVIIDGELPTVEKIDKYTVKFTTPKPFAPFLRQLSTPIAPMHILKPVTQKGIKDFSSFWSTTAKSSEFVVSGPFILSEYIPAQRVIFKRNPNYFIVNKNGEKLPYLDKYIVLIVGDLNNEILKFESGEIDLLDIRGSNVARFKEKEKFSDYKIYNLGPTTSTMFLSFNMNTRKNKDGKFYVNPKKQVWFNDLNFRKAVDYAIDRENMIFNIANGVAAPLFTAETLSSIFLNKKLEKGHPRDLEYAKKLLKDSGFYLKKDNKGAEQLFDRDNNKVEFDLYTNAGNTEREAIGVMIKQDLSELGIKVNFKPTEFNSLVNKISNTLDWDAMIIGLTGSPLEPHGGKNVWDSKGTLHLFNKRLEKDTIADRMPFEVRLDEIYNLAPLELDFARRKVLYDEYQQIVADNLPIIYLYSPIRISVIRKKFANVYPTPLGGLIHNPYEIYIKSE